MTDYDDDGLTPAYDMRSVKKGFIVICFVILMTFLVGCVVGAQGQAWEHPPVQCYKIVGTGTPVVIDDREQKE